MERRRCHITVRALEETDWEMFRAVRLRALRTDAGVFSSTYDEEKRHNEEQWKSWLSNEGKRVFGLFDDEHLIGITGVFTWKGDESGRTGIMAASYIEKDYRGQGLSRLLYEARLAFAKDYKQWDKLTVSHRKDNEASRRANQAFGFKYAGASMIAWPDGQKEEQLFYEMDLNELRKGEHYDRRHQL